MITGLLFFIGNSKAQQGSNECIDPQFKCGEIYQGDCAKEKPSDDYVPTGLKCLSLNGKDCQCWGKCPQDEACRKKYNDGVCSIESPGAGYKATSYKCPNGAESCTCWERVDSVPCEKKSCPKMRGLEGICGVEQPAKDFVKTDLRCDRSIDCSCWVKNCKPKSTSKNCKGGYCYPYGMSPGVDWEMNGYCNKFSKCTCWRQKSKACIQSKECKNVGGVCISQKEITDSMTVLKKKCPFPCICVKKPIDS